MIKKMKIAFLWSLCLIGFTANGYSFSTLSDPPPYLIGHWNLSLIDMGSLETVETYDVTLNENGYMVLFCDEAINAADWSWKDDSLTLHLRTDDPDLNSLDAVWKLIPSNESEIMLRNDSLGYSLKLTRRVFDMDL